MIVMDNILFCIFLTIALTSYFIMMFLERLLIKFIGNFYEVTEKYSSELKGIIILDKKEKIRYSSKLGTYIINNVDNFTLLKDNTCIKIDEKQQNFEITTREYQFFIIKLSVIIVENISFKGKYDLFVEAIEQVDDIIFITDEQGIIIYANKAFINTTGYEDYLGKHASLLESEKTNKEYYEEMQKKLKNNETFKYVVINKKKNGEEFYYDQEINVFNDKFSGNIFYMSTGRDVTENELIKEKVLSERDNFKILFNQSSDYLLKLNTNWIILEINKKALELTSKTREYFINKHFLVYLDEIKAIYDKSNIVEENTNFSMRLSTQNEKTYKLQISFLNNGLILADFEDLTDILKDEEFLKSTNDILKFQIERKNEELSLEKKKILKFLNSMNIPVIKIDKNFEVEFINNHTQKIFGIVNKDGKEDFIKNILKEDIDLIKNLEIENKKEIISFDGNYIGDNSRFDLLWTLVYLDDMDSSYILIGDDITNIKELIKNQEEILAKLQEQTKNIKCLYSISEIGHKNSTITSIIEKSLMYINNIWAEDLELEVQIKLFDKSYGNKIENSYKEKMEIPIYINKIQEGSIVIYTDNLNMIISDVKKLFKNIALTLEDAISTRIFEDKIIEKQNKLLELQKVGKLGTWEYSFYDKQLEISMETRRILGIPISYVLDIDEFIKRLSKDDTIKFTNLVEELKEKINEKNIELKYLKAKNEEINLSMHIKSKKDFNGTMKLLGTIYEVTNFVQIQKELEIAKVEAEKSNVAKSLFLANMSHEIRTPLNAILGFTQILLNKSSLIPQDREHIKIINRSGEHLLSLINDILDISKVESGEMEVRRDKFNIHLILKDIYNLFYHKSGEKQIEFSVNYSETLPKYFLGDAKKLKQVIVNLLGNTFKFTDEGSIHLNVYAEHIKDNNYLINFTVEDTGVGISDEDISRIFDKFYQASNSRAGTGLGLTITKNIIESIGGKVEVESEIDKGTKFKVIFELERVEVEEEKIYELKRIVNVSSPENFKRKILVVDDILENTMLLNTILKEIGLDVYTANNATEGLLLFERVSFDLIFMDIKLPDLDGKEVIKKMRLLEKNHPVIVGISASTFQEDIAEVIDAGADDFISKPVNLEELYEILNKYLDIKIYEDEVDESNKEVLVKPKFLKQIFTDDIISAIEEGNFFKIQELIDSLEEEHIKFKEECKALLDRFDYEKLKNLVIENTIN